MTKEELLDRNSKLFEIKKKFNKTRFDCKVNP